MKAFVASLSLLSALVQLGRAQGEPLDYGRHHAMPDALRGAQSTSAAGRAR